MAPSIGVSEFYAGKTIFITGATGFMGKVLIEKLLRCCPDVKRIYVLMRPKRGQTTKERIDDFINCRVFDYLQDKSPKSFDKISVIQGDILQDDLGISIQDWDTLQRETEILFHCAACVRFDMFIRDAVNMNTFGTYKVLKLADGMKKLQVFIHVSTSYCRCEVHTLEERLYPSQHKPQNIMQCMQWMDDDLLTYLQPKLIEPQPNTYAYTKSLTEDLVSQHAGKFPIVIARPSIVTAAYKEPLPGWVDNLNGPTGLLVGAGKGVIRTMHCNDSYLADVIPVDMAVNACIILSYLTALEKPKDIRICNVTQSGHNGITWGQALDLGRIHVQEFPFSVCLWYPGGSPKNSKVQHLIAAFFTHILPAYFVDFLMFLMGKKTFMVKIQKRVSYGLEVLQYYTTKEWFFNNDYYRSLEKQISKADNEIFYTNIEVVNWSSYIRNYIKGAREFCLKEDPSTLPQARKLHRQLYYLDKAVQFVVYSLIVYFIYYYIIRYLSQYM
ncbi:putative fatty acyl-CoA reductase CG5065 [Melitaea cinxia]|uniref:putative fatty acyl-CoA reductase CG5065 n=1 Tax=Melitaea cinxia TaxID=113334 RepID=UPI001E271C6B|nr:putative fatty acyl-CoA reductase CG5065 [Melitaea cinxia]